ncbi:hypothetical protein C4F50_25605 [Flavobacterium sp. KB82]|uniref:Uncharacterized protein n=1 Tax=Flavobacterium hungaricum TaxID=2082725 RepID=A0ABR9TSH1_9FLAO|nr:hypothetical protein [Flavobacterium hungaricum]
MMQKSYSCFITGIKNRKKEVRFWFLPAFFIKTLNSITNNLKFTNTNFNIKSWPFLQNFKNPCFSN